jgi:hypothetical protein
MPAYSISEAAGFLRIPTTLRARLRGQYSFPSSLNSSDRKQRRLSFINLVEAFVLAGIRRAHPTAIGSQGGRVPASYFQYSAPIGRRAIRYRRRQSLRRKNWRSGRRNSGRSDAIAQDDSRSIEIRPARAESRVREDRYLSGDLGQTATCKHDHRSTTFLVAIGPGSAEGENFHSGLTI